jgi:hypothetical protein
MGLVDTGQLSGLIPAVDAASVCRCGHCHAAIDVPVGRRRLRCQSCGQPNAIPSRIYVTCGRCRRWQSLRFGRRSAHNLCVNCGYPLEVGTIELTVLRRKVRLRAARQHHVTRRERILLTVLMYALVLLFFLLWFTRW